MCTPLGVRWTPRVGKPGPFRCDEIGVRVSLGVDRSGQGSPTASGQTDHAACEDFDRDRLADVVSQIDPCDAMESAHRARVLEWIRSGAELYRIRKPDEPAQHQTLTSATALTGRGIPPPTDQRYCINSISTTLEPAK